MVAPRECCVVSFGYFVTLGAVSNVMRYVYTGSFAYNAHSPEGNASITHTTSTDRHTQHRASTITHRGFLKPSPTQHPHATRETSLKAVYRLV